MSEKVLITGASGFLGTCISSHLKEHRDIVDIDLELGHDLSDENFVKEFFASHPAEYLVNCFALNDHIEPSAAQSTLFNISLDSFRRYLDVNLVLLFSVCREFARQESAKGIVNFSSIYGVVSPIPSLYTDGEKHVGYSVSKGGVVPLTKHLAAHLAPRVRVNCVVPGGARHKQGAQFQAAYSERVPMERMMEKDELNGLIRYLCSEESSYMTGSVIAVDGGWTCV